MRKKKTSINIIGLDEAGRGPLAGPVVAVAVRIKKINDFNKFGLKITDSKKMSPIKRIELCRFFSVNPVIEWGMGTVSEKRIDKINILEATKIAMQKSLKKINYNNSLLIIDGNFEIKADCEQKSIIKADEKIIECSIASIIAKVKRDEIMEKYHRKYPWYGFDSNKGYGTKKHFNAVKKHGLCQIHRKSFKIRKNKWFL